MHENVFPGGMPVEGKQGNYIALAATLAALGALLLCSQARSRVRARGWDSARR